MKSLYINTHIIIQCSVRKNKRASLLCVVSVYSMYRFCRRPILSLYIYSDRIYVSLIITV
jgi:hypothetical protein